MYFLIILFLLSTSAVFCKKNSESFVMLTISLMVITFTFAIRSETYGLDIITYYQIFLDDSYYELTEPGLNFLNLLISSISEEYFAFSFMYALFISLLVSILFWRVNPKLALSAFFLFTSTFVFFQLHLNIFRQGLACLIVLNALLLSKRYLILSIFIMALASLFHKAAILGWFFLFLRNRPVPTFMPFLTIVVAFIPFGDFLFKAISTFFSSLLPFLSYSLDEYVRLSDQGLLKESGFDHRNLPVIFTLLLVAFNKNKTFKETPFGELYLWVYIVTLLSASVFASNVLLYDRIILYAQILQPLFLACYIHYNIKFPRVWVFSIVFFQLLFTTLIWGPRNFLPEIQFLII